jgi:hypothetical protein
MTTGHCVETSAFLTKEPIAPSSCALTCVALRPRQRGRRWPRCAAPRAASRRQRRPGVPSTPTAGATRKPYKEPSRDSPDLSTGEQVGFGRVGRTEWADNPWNTDGGKRVCTRERERESERESHDRVCKKGETTCIRNACISLTPR